MSRPLTSDPNPSSPRYTAPALEKGLDILELLARSEGGLTQTEIANELNRSVSEIFRMLVVLEARGYIAQDGTSDRNVLTTKLFELAHKTSIIRRLSVAAGPAMRELAIAINQSVHLAVLSEDAVLIAAQVDPPARHVLSVRLGTRVDVWRASSGRVMMAFQPEETLTAMLKRAPLPDNVSEARLRKDLAEVRKRGYEVVDSFVVRGVVNISAPVIDYTGEAIAALTVPYIERYDEQTSFETCCQLTLDVAANLSRVLGAEISSSKSKYLQTTD